MKVFLSGAFKGKDEEKKMREIKSYLAKRGFEVWWAVDEFGKSYGKKLKESDKTIEIEKKAIKESKALVAVLKVPVPATLMELIFASENNIPVIAFILENADERIKESPWIQHHSQTIVENKADLVKALEELK